MLIYLLLFLFFGSYLSENSVFIYQTSTSNHGSIITCTISGINSDKHFPRLHCPLVKSHLCYTNCSSECEYSRGICTTLAGLEAIYNCKYIYRSTYHVEIQYFVNTENISSDKNGEWFCSYAGISSQSINIMSNKINAQENIVTKTRNFERKRNEMTQTVSSYDKMTNVIDVIRLPSATLKAQDIKQNSDKDSITFTLFVTKFEVVMVILSVLIISIVVNIVFCIRESMIKYYIENIKNDISSNKCLLLCVCQRDPIATTATAKLDRVLSKENDYVKFDHPLRQNSYEYDSQRPLIAPPFNERMPSYALMRPLSFQYFPQGHNEQIYVPLQSVSSQQLHPLYHHVDYANSNYRYHGSSSPNSSQTPREDVTREHTNKNDSKGVQGSVCPEPLTTVTGANDLDLIDDSQDREESQSLTNISVNVS